MSLVRRHWPLTARGTGALALGIACFVLAGELGLPVLVYFGVLLAAAVVMSLATLYLAPRHTALTRVTAPDVGAVGKDIAVTVRVQVRSALPTSPGIWEDTVPAGLDGEARGEFPATSSVFGRGRAGDAPVVLHYRLVGRTRGIHDLGPLAITTTDPFGLARRRLTVGDRTKITLAPATVDLDTGPAPGGEAGGTRQTVVVQLGHGTDDLIARPYAPGDSMRRVHWRATARYDEIMVRQEEQESRPIATVVLDRSAERWSREAARRPGLDAAFETAVSATLSVAARLVGDGFSVDVLDSTGAPLSAPLDGGEAGEVDLLARDLAEITTGGTGRLTGISRLFTGGTGPVVIVTGRCEPTDAEALGPLSQVSTLPVLLSASPSEDALTLLRARGWQVMVTPAGVDLRRVWDGAVDREARGVQL